MTAETKPRRPRLSEMDRRAALQTALARAQGDARRVLKDGTNAEEGYRFTSADAFIEEAKTHLAKHGLAVLPTGSRLVTMGTSGSGLLETSWELTHELGAVKTLVHQWPVLVEQGRPFDKAFASAHTAVLGYLLRDLLQLPRTEEGTGLDDPRPAPQPARARALPPHVPAPAAAQPSHQTSATRLAHEDGLERVALAVAAEFERLGTPIEERGPTGQLLLGRQARNLRDLRELLVLLRAQTPGAREEAGPLGASAEVSALLQRLFHALGADDEHEQRALVREILGEHAPMTSARSRFLADQLERRLATQRAHGVADA